MSRLNSKLVLKALSGDVFEIVKATNTLSHGVPGDRLDRKEVDAILKGASQRHPNNGKLDVEFIQ